MKLLTRGLREFELLFDVLHNRLTIEAGESAAHQLWVDWVSSHHLR